MRYCYRRLELIFRRFDAHDRGDNRQSANEFGTEDATAVVKAAQVAVAEDRAGLDGGTDRGVLGPSVASMAPKQSPDRKVIPVPLALTA